MEKEIQLPCSHASWAILSASFPLDKAAWDQMMAVLEAMKPALVIDNKLKEEEKCDENKMF